MIEQDVVFHIVVQIILAQTIVFVGLFVFNIVNIMMIEGTWRISKRKICSNKALLLVLFVISGLYIASIIHNIAVLF